MNCLPISGSTSSTAGGAQPLSLTGETSSEMASNYTIKTCGNGPAHQSLVTAPARVKTFENWPTATGQSAETMADAGFFHIGRSDHVKCFYCDGGLRNWEPNDDPWFEHARWFPKCTYVVLSKGADYVQKVIQSKPAVVPKQVNIFADLDSFVVSLETQILIMIYGLQYLSEISRSSNPSRPPRKVTDQELRNLMETPVVMVRKLFFNFTVTCFMI